MFITILLSIGLMACVAFGIALKLNKFKTVNNRYRNILFFVIPSVFAVLLMFLGLQLAPDSSADNNFADESSEADVNLIANALQDVYQTRQDVIGAYLYLNETDHEEYKWQAHLERNELPLPRIVLRLIQNDKFVSLMDTEMLASARAFERNVRKIEKWMSVDSLSNSNVAKHLNVYGIELWRFEEIISLFKEKLEQNLSDSAFSAMKQLLLHESYALMNDADIGAGRKLHPWRKLGP